MSSYQSPINIDTDRAYKSKQSLTLNGTNTGAIYDFKLKRFKVTDKISIKVNGKKYRLIEYHFHTPGEHKLCNKKFAAEVHYVFSSNSKTEYMGCSNTSNNSEEDIFVIARFIRDSSKEVDLSLLQVKIPLVYYQYNGSLSSGKYSPVLWCVGKHPIKVNLSEIEKISKDPHPIQEDNNRLIIEF